MRSFNVQEDILQNFIALISQKELMVKAESFLLDDGI